MAKSGDLGAVVESSGAFPPGGVLSSSEIRRLVVTPQAGDRPLIKGWKPDPNLKAARYDVRIKPDMPTAYGAPVESLLVAQFRDSLVLHPGGSAWFSTIELFCLPRGVAGTVTLRSEFAARGLFLLSGTLIDPCYGSQSEDDGRPLHFFLANLGCEPIVLQPRKDAIASVQFLIVAGEVEDAQDPGGDLGGVNATLGFIENLQRLQESHRELKEDVDRTRGLTNGLIVVGYFVLGTAVISASLATILSITSDTSLVNDIHAAVPKHDSGKLLLAVIVASVALVIYTAAVVLGPGGRVPTRSASHVDDLQRAALETMRSKARTSIMCVLIGALAGAIALGGGISSWDPDLRYWVWWVISYGLIAIVVVIAVQDLRKRFTTQEIRQRMSELALGSSRQPPSSRPSEQ